jgi:hypothetical protein
MLRAVLVQEGDALKAVLAALGGQTASLTNESAGRALGVGICVGQSGRVVDAGRLGEARAVEAEALALALGAPFANALDAAAPSLVLDAAVGVPEVHAVAYAAALVLRATLAVAMGGNSKTDANRRALAQSPCIFDSL